MDWKRIDAWARGASNLLGTVTSKWLTKRSPSAQRGPQATVRAPAQKQPQTDTSPTELRRPHATPTSQSSPASLKSTDSPPAHATWISFPPRTHVDAGDDRVAFEDLGCSEARVCWSVSPEACARAARVLGEPGELTLRVVSHCADPVAVVRTWTEDHGPVDARGQRPTDLEHAERCVAAIGLRASGKFVAIAHARVGRISSETASPPQEPHP